MNSPKPLKSRQSLRHRIEHSTVLASVLARVAGAYLSLCHRTTRWEVDGLDQLRRELADGPVLLVLWHRRSVMAAIHWPVDAGPLSSLYAASPIGRVSGALQRHRGLKPMEMGDGVSNLAASRKVLRRFRDGVSIGMTGDGPLGPDRVMKSAPIEWASRGPMRVWGYGFDTQRKRVLGTWDSMILPRPFGRGRIVFAPFDFTLETKPSAQHTRIASEALARFLDGIDSKLDRPYSD